MDDEDATLVDHAREGEAAALAQLYHRHAAPLLALGTRLAGNGSDAEDLVQDLFVALPEALTRYQDRGLLGSWLRRLLVRLFLMRRRRDSRYRDTTTDQVEEHPQPTAEVDAAEAVRTSLAALPEDLRVVVILRAIEGYSHEEIAALLGLRRNTVEVRYHRALRRVRVLLGEP